MPLNNIKVTPSGHIKNDNEMVENVEWKIENNILNKQVPGTPGRCPSEASTLSTNQDICRICHCEGDSNDNALVAPCYCSGSLRWVHQQCLQQWIKSSDIKCCELCKFQFIMQTKLKAFGEWESLQMTPLEKRKLLCSVTFHAVALTCVTWSLYILIDRTVEELQRGLLEWPFWTKLIVVAIGFSGGVVFMYIQCRAYINLCRRWKAYNRVIYIQNAPEKQALPIDTPELPQIITENPTQVYSCQKTNTTTNLNIPSHSLLGTSEVKSTDETLVYHDMNYKALQQVLNAHYSINLGCDKNDAIKTEEKEKEKVEKEKVVCCKKMDFDASSDEGETNGLLNI